MSEDTTFGLRYRALTSVADRLLLEQEEDRRAAYREIDEAIDALVLTALRGKRVVDVERTRRKRDIDRVLLLVSEAARPSLTEHYSAEHHHERGAWYLPEKAVTLPIGLIQLAYWMREDERFALTLSGADVVTASMDTVDEIAIWSTLEPLFDELYLPLKLRSFWLGTQTSDEQRKLWTKTVEPAYAAFGVASEEVQEFAAGEGWEGLDADAVTARRTALVQAWGRADAVAVARLRTYRIGQLVERYYTKAKNGLARRRQVVTKAFERTLSAYFGGDWLAFVAYLGERPDPGEELTSTLPKTQVMVASAKRVATVAGEHGLAAEEVERMLAAFWGQSTSTSPVEQRVRALQRLWEEFDAVHARQRSGMPPLWGLMAQGRPPSIHEQFAGYNPGIEEQLLTADLQTEMKRLWSTKINRNPERLVTNPHWASAAASAFGPAFELWHEVAVNAWFICEGPYAGTNLEMMALKFHERAEPLSALGCPIDPALWGDLKAAESRLGPEEQTWRETYTTGLVTMNIGGGTRRDGFEILRDIVTRHRRAWADRYPEYLEKRWKAELRTTGHEYSRFVADREKPPTVKQFLKVAHAPAVHWFGGDVTGVYGALGLKSPQPPPTYSRVLPDNWRGLVVRVFENLGGHPLLSGDDLSRDEAVRNEQIAANKRNGGLDHLAGESLRWVELAETLGRAPTLKEFGARTIEYRGDALPDDPEEAWQLYSEAVQRALSTPTSAPTSPPARVSGAETTTHAVVEAAVLPTTAPETVAVVPRNNDAPDVAQLRRHRSLLDRMRGR